MAELETLLALLHAHYGEPETPSARGPFEFVLWENAVYLLPDERRREVFESLRKQVGLTPEAIAQASGDLLLALATRGGMRPETRAFRWREIARITNVQFAGNLDQILAWPYDKAKRALKQFPTIGDPGAEKILMLCGVVGTELPLESNGLRVLTRAGFGRSQKSYSATYKSVQAAIAGEALSSQLVTHHLLREHGKTFCKLNGPLCDHCPAREACQRKL